MGRLLLGISSHSQRHWKGYMRLYPLSSHLAAIWQLWIPIILPHWPEIGVPKTPFGVFLEPAICTKHLGTPIWYGFC